MAFDVEFSQAQRFPLVKFSSGGSMPINAAGAQLVGGVNDYEKARNKPKINGVELTGDKTLEDLGEQTIGSEGIRDSVNKAFSIVFGG